MTFAAGSKVLCPMSVASRSVLNSKLCIDFLCQTCIDSKLPKSLGWRGRQTDNRTCLLNLSFDRLLSSPSLICPSNFRFLLVSFSTWCNICIVFVVVMNTVKSGNSMFYIFYSPYVLSKYVYRLFCLSHAGHGAVCLEIRLFFRPMVVFLSFLFLTYVPYVVSWLS